MSKGREERIGTEVRAFESYVRVRFHEVDALGHVNNAAYVNYLEQAAIDHAMQLGLDIDRLRGLGGVFVAHRHDVEFLRPAFAGELLRVVTWLGEPSGARVDRHYRLVRVLEAPAQIPTAGALVAQVITISDAVLVARAKTEWVFASERGVPRRIPRDIVERFRSGQAA